MKRKLKIEKIIKDNVNYKICNVLDVSESHRGHQGFKEGVETHFKIYIVSEDFKNFSILERQKYLNKLLAEEFKSDLHSVSYKLITTSEQK